MVYLAISSHLRDPMGEVFRKIRFIFRFLSMRSDVIKTCFDLQFALLLLYVEMPTDYYVVNQ